MSPPTHVATIGVKDVTHDGPDSSSIEHVQTGEFSPSKGGSRE